MVRIITDSAADFEPRELERMRVFCIPLSVIFGETEYQENVNLSKKRFYELLATADSLPKTAQASPQILLDLFDSAKHAGDEAVYITISSAISGTYQSARMTLEMAECDRCHVVDSRSGTGGQRMIVEHAVKLRDAGYSAAQIVEELERLRSRVTLYACMDTLENLYRGGRISHTTYAIGNLAQIKPIIHLDEEGKVTVPAKAMGMRKGVDLLCKKLEQCRPDPDYPLYVMYTSDRSAAEALALRLADMGYAVADERIIQVGAAIGTHIGPNAVGLVYIGE